MRKGFLATAIFTLMSPVFFYASPAQAFCDPTSTACISASDKTCDQLGRTTIDKDKKNIIACLGSALGNDCAAGQYQWKSMTSSSSALNIIKVEQLLCTSATGPFTIIATCPAGYALLGCAGGPGGQNEEYEYWYLDPDFSNGRCLGHAQKPVCWSDPNSSARVIASCYKL